MPVDRLPDTPIEDLAYLVECTLATVEWLDCKTRPPKGELERQQDIAEFGILCLRQHGYDPDAPRGRLRQPIRVNEIIRKNAGHNYGRPIMPWTKTDVVSKLGKLTDRKTGRTPT